MGLLDKALKKKEPPLPKVKAQSIAEGLRHPTVVAGTHDLLICNHCSVWFRYGIHVKFQKLGGGTQDPHGSKCPQCDKGTLHFHARSSQLKPLCNKWKAGMCSAFKRREAVYCPIARAAFAESGECISHPYFRTLKRMLELHKGQDVPWWER